MSKRKHIIRNVLSTRSKNKTFYSQVIGEWLFALYLFAGNFKMDPRLSFIQNHIDITIFLFILSFSIYLYNIFIRRSISWPTKKYAMTIGLFVFLLIDLIGSLIYSDSTQYGIDKVLRFAILTGWAFFGAATLIRNVYSLKRFAWSIVIVAFIISIDSLVGHIEKGEATFVNVPGVTYIALARAAGLGFLIILTYLYLISSKAATKLILFSMALILIYAALQSGSRGPVLGLLPSMAIFIILSIRGIRTLRMERYTLSLIALMFIALAALVPLINELFPTLAFRMRVLWTEGGTSALTRIEYYYKALDMWANSPVFGNGAGSFGLYVTGMDVRLYPHNIILELGAETGVIGVTIFMALFIWSIIYAIPAVYSKTLSIRMAARLLIIVITYILFNAMISGDINDNRMLFTWLALTTSISAIQTPTSNVIHEYGDKNHG